MSYEAGYNAAYAEIYAALDDIDHARRCRGCRACEAMKETLHWAMQNLSRALSSEEFLDLAKIVASAERKGSAVYEATVAAGADGTGTGSPGMASEPGQGRSRVVRFRPDTYARARGLYPAPPEVEVKPDDVIGYVLDMAERQQERKQEAKADHSKQ